MKHLFDSLAIWLIVAIRHWLRCAVVMLCLAVFATGGYFNGGDWYGAFVGAMIGAFFGIVLAFGDELADALEK